MRLDKLAATRSTIEARAKERSDWEQAEHQAKIERREAKIEATGKKLGGKPPQSPVEGPLPTDQANLTDEGSCILPVAGGGFEQGYNAQAVVAEGSLLVVAVDAVQAVNDKRLLEPMLNKVVRCQKLRPKPKHYSPPTDISAPPISPPARRRRFSR